MSKNDPNKTAAPPAADDTADAVTPPADAETTPGQDTSNSVSSDLQNETAPKRFRVNFQFGLNLRASPSYEGAILKVLPCGTEADSLNAVEIGDTTWVNVEHGWVDSRYLTEV